MQITGTLQKALVIHSNKGFTPINSNISHFTNEMSLSGISGPFTRALSYNFVMTVLYSQASGCRIARKAPDCHGGVSLLRFKLSREAALFRLFKNFTIVCICWYVCERQSERDSGFFINTHVVVIYIHLCTIFLTTVF